MDLRMKSGWVSGEELRACFENELETVYSKNLKNLGSEPIRNLV
jgi:hypothetical protein